MGNIRFTCPQIQFDVTLAGRVQRFDSVAADEQIVMVEYGDGDFSPPEPGFIIINKVSTIRPMVMEGSHGAQYTLPEGFDITDAFTHHQIDAMQERIMAELKEYAP